MRIYPQTAIKHLRFMKTSAKTSLENAALSLAYILCLPTSLCCSTMHAPADAALIRGPPHAGYDDQHLHGDNMRPKPMAFPTLSFPIEPFLFSSLFSTGRTTLVFALHDVVRTHNCCSFSCSPPLGFSSLSHHLPFPLSHYSPVPILLCTSTSVYLFFPSIRLTLPITVHSLFTPTHPTAFHLITRPKQPQPCASPYQPSSPSSLSQPPTGKVSTSAPTSPPAPANPNPTGPTTSPSSAPSPAPSPPSASTPPQTATRLQTPSPPPSPPARNSSSASGPKTPTTIRPKKPPCRPQSNSMVTTGSSP